MTERKIPVMEIFGPTIQGEGRMVGRKTMFLRTGGCDYSCSWCDSKFTWDGSEKATMMTPTEIWQKMLDLGSVNGHLNFNHVTISGGNPALTGDAMGDLLELFAHCGIDTGLETQGSRWQHWFYDIDDLCISPKPPSSGMTTDFDKLHDIIARLVAAHLEDPEVYREPYLKVVIFDDADYEFAKKVHRLHPTLDFFVSVGNSDVSADGDITARLLLKYEWLVNKIVADPEMNNVRPLPQLHTLIWGNKRGV